MPNPSTPLPRVGEVWGEPDEPAKWRFVKRVTASYVDYSEFYRGGITYDTVNEWREWSRDKQLIQPRNDSER